MTATAEGIGLSSKSSRVNESIQLLIMLSSLLAMLTVGISVLLLSPAEHTGW